jgi:hypothetical protein
MSNLEIELCDNRELILAIANTIKVGIRATYDSHRNNSWITKTLRAFKAIGLIHSFDMPSYLGRNSGVIYFLYPRGYSQNLGSCRLITNIRLRLKEMSYHLNMLVGIRFLDSYRFIDIHSLGLQTVGRKAVEAPGF